MKKLVTEVTDIAEELQEENKDLTSNEALLIASKIQYNRILSEGFVLGVNAPTALEAIAMALGYKGERM